ncbi:unnamed protein product [Bemisia tabaci]|uniref:Ionotropic receptor n=1 Tax=Bemisia tabaci TaxID=7038 RepID=A0A9P0F3C8_BEMTA|nr:unnamed protein product [Bemisia tabaci]
MRTETRVKGATGRKLKSGELCFRDFFCPCKSLRPASPPFELSRESICLPWAPVKDGKESHLFKIVFVYLVVLSTSDLQRPKESKRESLHLLAFHVCQNIANRTDLKLFYTVDLDSDPSFQHLIQDLHGTSIQTISITHHGGMTDSMVTDQRKNIIFNFNDIDELFNFIFHTISPPESLKMNREMETGFEGSTENTVNQTKKTLPRYCIKVDEFHYFSQREGCSKEVRITSSELENGSILSDSVYNATSGFYLNKIWNFRNHLIFLLKNVGHCAREFPSKIFRNVTFPTFETNKRFNLILCFKFFWRFFKGQKTIICHPDGCEKYDPFTESLIFYQGWAQIHEDFLDFSWTNMHEKSILVIEDYSEPAGLRSFRIETWMSGSFFFDVVLENLVDAVNCTLRTLGPYEIHKAEVRKNALKYDVSLLFFNNEIISEGTDYSELDISASVDTSALCIATPHSGYMSQGLVIFKSFSPLVWIFISATFASLTIMQYFYQYSQYALFPRLYTETEVDYYRDTSSLLIVYAYFICGSSPSLHLGRLFTGKVLFLIFSFSTIIISTIFLSGMTTLLSDRVLYPEIDSIRSLEESNMLIQTHKKENTETSIFDHLNLSESLRASLADNFYYYTDVVILELMEILSTYDPVLVNFAAIHDFFLNLTDIGNSVEKIDQNVRSITETDALLLGVPSSSTPQKNLRMRSFLNDQWYDYHLMVECLMTYPVIFTFAKNSFLFDRMDRMMAQYFETGHARRILGNISVMRQVELGVSYAENDPEPRAFNLDDLQSGFIGLVVGLFMSFLAFVGELLFDYFQFSATVKVFVRFKDSLFKKIRGSVKNA